MTQPKLETRLIPHVHTLAMLEALRKTPQLVVVHDRVGKTAQATYERATVWKAIQKCQCVLAEDADPEAHDCREPWLVSMMPGLLSRVA